MISGRIKSFILGILLGYLSLSAHPHIFIDGSLNFVTNGKNISGLHLIWTWDENWSNDIINDCDTDGDGIFNKVYYFDFLDHLEI